MLSLKQQYKFANIIPSNNKDPRLGTVYYIKIITKDVCLYKIGYTRLDVVTRIKGIIRYIDDIQVHLIASLSNIPTDEVYVFEQIMHSRCKNTYVWYKGVNIINNGNTELYHWDVLGLDTEDNKNIEVLFNVPKYVTVGTTIEEIAAEYALLG